LHHFCFLIIFENCPLWREFFFGPRNWTFSFNPAVSQALTEKQKDAPQPRVSFCFSVKILNMAGSIQKIQSRFSFPLRFARGRLEFVTQAFGDSPKLSSNGLAIT
jgi:hypothetical protein